MIKQILKKQKISIRQLSINADIPYSTLNDIVNGKVDIDNVRLGYIRKIADSLNMSIDELVNNVTSGFAEEYYKVVIHNKAYYLESDQMPGQIYLCKVTSLSSRYIHDMARWEYEDYMLAKEADSWREKITY